MPSNIEETTRRLDRLERKLEDARKEWRSYQTVMMGSLNLSRRLGLPENIDDGMRKVQRAIILFNQARIAANLFWAAAGPVGWAMVGISVVSVALTAEDFLWDIRGH